jgi:hypothetical protein
MLMAILLSSSRPVKLALVNWLPWIGVENFRPAVRAKRLLDRLDAKSISKVIDSRQAEHVE